MVPRCFLASCYASARVSELAIEDLIAEGAPFVLRKQLHTKTLCQNAIELRFRDQRPPTPTGHGMEEVVSSDPAFAQELCTISQAASIKACFEAGLVEELAQGALLGCRGRLRVNLGGCGEAGIEGVECGGGR